MNNLSLDELNDFFVQLDVFEQELELEKMQNEFLELYHEWLVNQNKKLKEKINKKAQEISELDPDFKFTPLD